MPQETVFISERIFNQGLNSFQGVGAGLDTLKYNLPPDAQGLIVNRIPEIFFTGKMAVEPALGQTGGFQDIVDRSVVIALDAKKLQRFCDDVSARPGAFVRHKSSSSNNKPTGRIINHVIVPSVNLFRMISTIAASFCRNFLRSPLKSNAAGIFYDFQVSRIPSNNSNISLFCKPFRKPLRLTCQTRLIIVRLIL